MVQFNSFMKCVNVKDSFDVVMVNIPSTDTLKAQIMIDISSTPGWITTLGL